MFQPNKKRMRPFLLVAMVLLIIIVVSLHAVGAISFSKTGFGAFSLNNPIFYVLIGLFLAFVPFKLKHLLGLLHRKEKQSAREISHGIRSTSDVLHKRRQEDLS
jgi:hypothetical protein